MQLRQLNLLLDALRNGNRFYQQRLRKAGLDGPVTSIAAFLAACPFTTKSDLELDQQQHPPFGTNLTFPIAQYCRFSQTSGTTGRPMRWLDTAESWSWMVDRWVQVFEAAGVRCDDRVFFAFSFGPFLGFWVAFDAAERIGCLAIPGGGMSSVARLHTLLASGATVLCCTPTYALHLAAVAAQEKIGLSDSAVRAIIVAGEPGGSIPATRERLQQAWPGARVFDHHGMTEIGPASYACPKHPNLLHIMEAGFIAEVLDRDSGKVVPPGGTGELILTNLGRTGSPLLRYRTGDLVKIAAEPQCACGSVELALEGGIIGRADDMVAVRGVNVYPSALEAVLRDFAGIAEYRVTFESRSEMNEMAVEIEPTPECADIDGLVAGVQHALRLALALRVPVRAAAPNSLPRFEMKARRWVKGGNG